MAQKRKAISNADAYDKYIKRLKAIGRLQGTLSEMKAYFLRRMKVAS